MGTKDQDVGPVLNILGSVIEKCPILVDRRSWLTPLIRALAVLLAVKILVFTVLLGKYCCAVALLLAH
jgi:hypothetical protein